MTANAPQRGAQGRVRRGVLDGGVNMRERDLAESSKEGRTRRREGPTYGITNSSESSRMNIVWR